VGLVAAQAGPVLTLRRAQGPQFTKEDPWADDDLGRREFGLSVIKLVRGLEQPFSIALQADWGGGKTTLLERIRHELSNREHAIVAARFDAWANEQGGDPLVGFTSAIAGALSDYIPNNRSDPLSQQAGKLLRKTAQILKKVAPVVGPAIAAGTAAVAAGVVDDATLAAGEAGARGALDAMDASQKQSTPEELSARFREQLDTTVRAVRTELPGGGCKLLVIVDELDRCRPDYAIRVLERIKHFFQVPGVVFLLASDQGYLESAVKSVYGATIGAERYLRRFIEFELRVPSPSASALWRTLWRRLEFESLFAPNPETAFRRLGYLIEPLLGAVSRRLSIRDIEQVLMRFRFALAVVDLDDDSRDLALSVLFSRSLRPEELRDLPDANAMAKAFSHLRSLLNESGGVTFISVLLETAGLFMTSGEAEVLRMKTSLMATMNSPVEPQDTKETAEQKLKTLIRLERIRTGGRPLHEMLWVWANGSMKH
jgi:hypothetical protein